MAKFPRVASLVVKKWNTPISRRSERKLQRQTDTSDYMTFSWGRWRGGSRKDPKSSSARLIGCCWIYFCDSNRLTLNNLLISLAEELVWHPYGGEDAFCSSVSECVRKRRQWMANRNKDLVLSFQSRGETARERSTKIPIMEHFGISLAWFRNGIETPHTTTLGTWNKRMKRQGATYLVGGMRGGNSRFRVVILSV